MKIQESPALTRVPVLSSRKETIELLKEQISELRQQKKCYDKMILDRRKAIIQLKRRKLRGKR